MQEFSEVRLYLLILVSTYYLQYFSILITLTYRADFYQFSFRVLRQQLFAYTNIRI